MLNKKRVLPNQDGMTFIEIIFYVAVLGIIFGIVIPLLTGGRDSTAVSMEITQMRSTMDNISNRYFAEPIDAGLTNEQVIEGRLLARSYRTSGTDIIYNQFGGMVQINGVQENGIIWETNSIPEDVCLEFVQQARGLGFLQVDTGTGAQTYSQVGVAELTTACSGGSDGDIIETITFTIPASA